MGIYYHVLKQTICFYLVRTYAHAGIQTWDPDHNQSIKNDALKTRLLGYGSRIKLGFCLKYR